MDKGLLDNGEVFPVTVTQSEVVQAERSDLYTGRLNLTKISKQYLVLISGR